MNNQPQPDAGRDRLDKPGVFNSPVSPDEMPEHLKQMKEWRWTGYKADDLLVAIQTNLPMNNDGKIVVDKYELKDFITTYAGTRPVQPTGGDVREQIKALKPHTANQLPLGDLLSPVELEAVVQVIEQLLTTQTQAAEEKSQAEAFMAGCLFAGMPEEDGQIILEAYNQWREEGAAQ